ncbi:MAG TPA: hypothetical protein VJ913_11800 [Actinomycetota bacterium]|nr:hypothetical protein [Actinomycetota bacterium]
MRWLRGTAAAIAAGAALATPGDAFADGGAYIELDRTHYLVGSTATGEAYVSVPEGQQRVFEEGPFYVFVLPGRSWIQERRPIPNGALRVGTVTIEHDRGSEFKVRMSFTVPELPGDYYNVGICNDPCTIAGFREPLTTEISIVATVREGELLTENSSLYSKTWNLRRQVRRSERTNEELEDRLSYGNDQLLEYTGRIEGLERRLTARNHVAPAASEDRPLIDAWAFVTILGAAIAAAFGIGLAMVFSRRPARPLEAETRLDEELGLLLRPGSDSPRASEAGIVR